VQGVVQLSHPCDAAVAYVIEEILKKKKYNCNLIVFDPPFDPRSDPPMYTTEQQPRAIAFFSTRANGRVQLQISYGPASENNVSM
jgi:hypothetical protein